MSATLRPVLPFRPLSRHISPTLYHTGPVAATYCSRRRPKYKHSRNAYATPGCPVLRPGSGREQTRPERDVRLLEIIITEPILRSVAPPPPPFAPSANPRDFEPVQPAFLQQRIEAVWRRLGLAAPVPAAPSAGSLPYDLEIPRQARRDLLALRRRREFDSKDWFLLGLQAEYLSAKVPFDRLLAVEFLRQRWRQVGVIPYPHQLETARRVLQEMGGRAILADEVGLGKTIEAGLILKEAVLRGLVHRALVLTPATLTYQWEQELREKFAFTPRLARRVWDWDQDGVVIASLDLAKRSPYREKALSQDWDMVIIDEAHRLKSSRTQNWQLAQALKKKYFLLLTATPVQNDLKELYNLITLLTPGQLGTYSQFQARYMAGKRQPKNAGELRKLLQQVMVRNRRGSQTVRFTARRVESRDVELSPSEAELYRRVTALVSQTYRRYRLERLNPLPLIMLQREASSSPYAVMLTLDKIFSDWPAETLERVEAARLIQLAQSIRTTAKWGALTDILRQHPGEKILVFTEFRATMIYLIQQLQALGLDALAFDGGLSSGQKEWLRHLFRQRFQVLVSTEAGGEGLNFQFCHIVVNFDLPWNPMRLEQRIGRVHRLGQEHDVFVYHLVTAHTVESHVLHLLHEKLAMFDHVIGAGEDHILAAMDGLRPAPPEPAGHSLGGHRRRPRQPDARRQEKPASRGRRSPEDPGWKLETLILDAVANSSDDAELHRRLENLAARLAAARRPGSRAWWDVLD